MTPANKRVAVNLGGGYVPGLNAVITGVVLAANELGWEAVGIRDGFDGLLLPEQYPEGGFLHFNPQIVENLASSPGAILGTAARNDPFHMRTVNAENQVEEIDRSEELLTKLQAAKIDAVISVVEGRALGILWKLARQGLPIVAVPKSVENDIAATMLSFGFNSALSYLAETLDRARQAAQAARKIGVVEVLGEHAGWLALQSAIAVHADAALIPEIPYDLCKVAQRLRAKFSSGRHHGLVVVAEGAKPASGSQQAAQPLASNPLKASLSPGATGDPGPHAINRSGHAAATVALELQRLTDHETYPLVLGQLVKGGVPTAVDRQLGLAYGAGAVRAVREGQTAVMVAFQPPDLTFVPLSEAVNQIRTVPADSVFIETARALGIVLGN
jgi:ATP-dependent phosphofructokinase / diphosphate-dependent phosphofructokinase